MDVFTQVGFECEIDGGLIEFDITPNRGDVLSLKGLEREFCAYQVKKSKNRLETFALKLNKDNHMGCSLSKRLLETLLDAEFEKVIECQAGLFGVDLCLINSQTVGVGYYAIRLLRCIVKPIL